MRVPTGMAKIIDWASKRGNRWVLLILLAFVAGLRLWAVLRSDLPTGDEINTYIFNGQRFAKDASLPSLANFPGVALVYGLITYVLDCWLNTLSGVVAARIVTIVSGIISACCLFKTVKSLSDGYAAVLTATVLAVFPGTFFVFRGDLSLYLMCLAVLQLSLVRFVQRPSIGRATITGIISALFLLSHSDGLFISALSLTVFLIMFRRILRYVPVTIVAFACAVGSFLLVRYAVMGDFGPGPGNRALSAFYQAEGLHDRRGGSWHDYTARGIARFGTPEEYNHSVTRIILKNPKAVFERTHTNLKVIMNYLKRATGLPIWICIGLLYSTQ